MTVSHQIKQRFLSAFIQGQAVNQDHCNPSEAGTRPTIKLTSTGQRRELPSWELQLQFQRSRAQPSALESGCDSCSSRLLQTSNILSAIFHLLCKSPPRTQSLIRTPGKMNCRVLTKCREREEPNSTPSSTKGMTREEQVKGTGDPVQQCFSLTVYLRAELRTSSPLPS